MVVPREHEEPFNKSPVIRAVSALLLVILSLAFLTRLFVRLATVRFLKKDDILVTFATILAVCQSLIIVIQGANRFGQPGKSFDSEEADSILKRQFASDILYVCTLVSAKLSASRTISDLAATTRRPHIWILEACIGIWGLSSIFLQCFQCDGSAPWDYINGRCMDRAAMWTYIDAMNIATDIALTAIVVELVTGLNSKTSMKTTIVALFSSRLLTIPPICAHILLFRGATTSADPIFDMWKPVITIQVIQCITIITTCTPFLKPFMDSLDSGVLVPADPRQTKASASRSCSTDVLTYGRRKGSMKRSRAENSASLQRRSRYEGLEADSNGRSLDPWSFNEGVTTATAASTANSKPWDQGSQSSQAVLVESSWTLEVEQIAGERSSASLNR